jgi:flagellar basal-body rod modification protein FlgD
MSHHIAANYTMPTLLNPIKSATTSPTSTSPTTGSSTSGTDASDIGTTFLSLLTQELQNQDPTAPMDSTAMVGQMISLNQLAQLTSINQAVGGSTTSATGARQSAGTAVSVTPTATASKSSQPATTMPATGQFPFDPNTMMPLSSGVNNAAVLATSMNPSFN